ncbi:MAG: intradiol ring-cleavage dioxygenase [Alphaproteobacteria bacterium]|nr:intradiol ring-cleavage dioxygenase [Alphaproteobacteria bacterium]
MDESRGSTRRRFILTAGTLAAGYGLYPADGALAQPLSPTPECSDGAAPTQRQTEGPFFKPSSPERTDLVEAGMRGQTLVLTGFVLTRGCKPVARALIDFWQADTEGQYDNSGNRLRGHQFTDAEGRYRLRTVVPASYPGRTRHLHVKVQPPGGRILTTQLYFPGEAHNRTDRFFRRELLVRTALAKGDVAGRFDFVLDMR